MGFKKIGVLGGAGPEATAAFYYEILHYCRAKYHAVQDTDYPPMVIYSLPLYGFNETGILDEKIVLEQLLHGIETLEHAKCDIISIPCNTVHYFINELRAKSSVPIISILEETAKKIKEIAKEPVALLASETTLKLKLYDNIFDQNNIIHSIPQQKDIRKITNLIFEVMSGNVSIKAKKHVIKIIQKMHASSAKSVILGCTELPLAIKQEDIDIPLCNTLQILAHATVDCAAAHEKIHFAFNSLHI